MRIVLLCNMAQKEELTAQMQNTQAELIHAADPANVAMKGADVCIDLLFINTNEHKEKLLQLQTKLVIVDSVLHTLNEFPADFIRINGWSTFLKRPIIEAAGPDNLKEIAEEVFSFFNKKVEWVPDIAGFISVRVIASIVNEAYFALEEQVSSKEEIDTAMKLGTNYPYGPFEWSEKIGLNNIYMLLASLSENQKRYTPSQLLVKEATQ